mmetsp:Transcript_116685/g.249475  ORF Transcript_116685/g.249475 Transcript_116685/m.249475 type:complete len:354 (+) Transcript_116685:787-1848(+)
MIQRTGQPNTAAASKRPAAAPHLGSDTFRMRSSVMPPMMPSSRIPARWKIPATSARSLKPAARSSSQLSMLVTSTILQCSAGPWRGVDEPTRRMSTNCSGDKPWSLINHSNTTPPTPPVAPVRMYCAGRPLALFLGTQGRRALGSIMGCSRGAHTVQPWNTSMPLELGPKGRTQRSVSSAYCAARLTSLGAKATLWSAGAIKHSSGKTKRWICSSLASIAAALLAPKTMEPAAPAGPTARRRPPTPASPNCCRTRTNCQLSLTSFSKSGTPHMPAAPRLVPTITTRTCPAFIASTALCKSSDETSTSSMSNTSKELLPTRAAASASFGGSEVHCTAQRGSSFFAGGAFGATAN